MNKYIDISTAAGAATSVRATGVASVYVDQTVSPDAPLIIMYRNGSKYTITATATAGDDSFTNADADILGKAIVNTASTNWREVSSKFDAQLSQPIATTAFTF